MPRISKIVVLLLLCALSSYFFIYKLDQPSIRETDESTHIKVIQEMTRSGNYFSPTLEGGNYKNKPPLKMWLTIGVTKFFGESTFTYRIIDGLSGIGVVLITVGLGYLLLGSFWSGAVAGFLLLLSPGFLFELRYTEATQDAFLNFLWVGALLWGIATARAKRLDLSAFGFGVIVGCGFITKLFAIFTVIPVMALYLWLVGVRGKDFLRYVFISAPVALVVLSIFFLPRALQNTQSVTSLFNSEINHRILQKAGKVTGDVWLYFDHFFVRRKCLVSIILIPALLFAAGQCWWARSWSSSKGVFVLLVWSIGVTTLYSLVSSRVEYYIAPVYPALALLGGHFLVSCFSRVSLKSWPTCLAGGLLLLVLVFPLSARLKSVVKTQAKKEGTLDFERKLARVKSVLQEQPNTRFFVYRLDAFKKYYGNNSWRHKAYLTMAHQNQEKVNDVQELLGVGQPFFIFLPTVEVAELLKSLPQPPCEQIVMKTAKSPRKKSDSRMKPDQYSLLGFATCQVPGS